MCSLNKKNMYRKNNFKKRLLYQNSKNTKSNNSLIKSNNIIKSNGNLKNVCNSK